MSIIEAIKNGAKFIALALLVSSCSPEEGSATEDGYYMIKTIDSCEYIVYNFGMIKDRRLITHKGNCKYCAERNKKSNVVTIGETTQSIQ